MDEPTYATPGAGAAPVRSPASSTVTTLDRSAVENLVALCGEGGTEVVAALLDTLFTEAPRLLCVLRNGVSTGDPEAVALAAHTLKGHANSFGATLLARPAGDLETLGRSGRLDGAEALVSEVEAAYERSRHELEAVRVTLLGGQPGPGPL